MACAVDGVVCAMHQDTNYTLSAAKNNILSIPGVHVWGCRQRHWPAVGRLGLAELQAEAPKGEQAQLCSPLSVIQQAHIRVDPGFCDESLWIAALKPRQVVALRWLVTEVGNMLTNSLDSEISC
jgi:hypothetical protein